MSSEQSIRDLLGRVARNEIGVDKALNVLRALPFESLGDATLDHHRQLRDGFGEVVYCGGKTPDQCAKIIGRLAHSNNRVLATRATRQHYEAARSEVSELQYHKEARAIWLDREPDRPRSAGVVVVSAGTSDQPVTEEALLTLDLMGHDAIRIIDVGIAGLHRLLHHVKTLQSANVIVVVAGMEGALPGVVAGLVAAPVIAVPTSVGYGASLQGITALLGMVSGCAAGVAVVNIDNGFGAGYLAAIINQKITRNPERESQP